MKLFVAIGLILFGGCLAGCASMAKFTPEQLASIDKVAEVVGRTARENQVHAIGRVRLVPVEFGFKEAVYMSGIEAEITFSANPAAGQ